MKPWILALGLLLAAVSSPSLAATRKVALPELAAPTCPPPLLTFDSKTGACVPADKDKVAALKEEACPKANGFAFANGKCTFDQAKAPAPACNKSVSNLVYDADAKSCLLVTGQPSSSPGDYVSDCFKVVGVPEGSGLEAGKYYTVTNQRDEQDDDHLLSVVEGDLNWVPVPGLFGCKATKGPKRMVLASSLMDNGAQRFGWAYGALAMPYKYYPKSKTFVAGLPIGAYLGWRMGRAGSGVTLAAAMTLSQVKADTIDPKTLDMNGKPTVTGTTDVAALSGAIGLVFDVSKRPGLKAFKAGAFVGKDRINRSPTIDFKQQGQWWMALQLGFDFTDN